MSAFDSWVERARSVPIELALERRGIILKGNGSDRCGPCPKCGGDDRFSINIRKQVFNCRGCGAHGDIIAMTQFFDGGDFKAACTMLTGEPPPKPNGKARAEPKKIVAERFDYPDADGKLLLQVERVEFLKADGTFVITKDGKSKKTFRQRQPDPERPGEWIWNVEGVAPIPYRLPELIEAVGNKQSSSSKAKPKSTCCARGMCQRRAALWARGSGGQSTPHSCKMPTLCCFLIMMIPVGST